MKSICYTLRGWSVIIYIMEKEDYMLSEIRTFNIYIEGGLQSVDSRHEEPIFGSYEAS